VTTFGDIYFNGGSVFELTRASSKATSPNAFSRRPAHLRIRQRFAQGGQSRDLQAPARKGNEPASETKDPKTAADSTDTKSKDADAKDAAAKDSKDAKDPKTKKAPATKSTRWLIDELASIPSPPLESLIMAGNRIYGGGDNFIIAFDYDASTRTSKQSGRPKWTQSRSTDCRLRPPLRRHARRANLLFGPGDLTARHYPLRAAFPAGESGVFQTGVGLARSGRRAEGYAVAGATATAPSSPNSCAKAS